MSESLRDQLLKSGLAKKLRPEPSKPTPAAAKTKAKPACTPDSGKQTRKAADVDLAHAYALRARQEKEDRERVQREAERAAREKKERKAKLAAVLEGRAFNSAEADLPRHFPHGNKIRRVYCTQQQLAQLNRGELAVVQLAGRYVLVSRDVALAAQAINPESLVLLCDPDAPPEDDVPPDLVW